MHSANIFLMTSLRLRKKYRFVLDIYGFLKRSMKLIKNFAFLERILLALEQLRLQKMSYYRSHRYFEF
jgi:hypothetical protein